MKSRILTIGLLGALMLTVGSALAINNLKAGGPLTVNEGPDRVLKTLEWSVIKRSFEDYRSVLSDSFVYVPDSGTIEMYPKIDWENWGIDHEEIFLKKFLSPILKSELNVTDRITERGMPFDNKATYEITYLIKIQGNLFVGGGLFVFEEVDHEWFLLRWEEKTLILDDSTGGYFTNSGEVRASLAP